MSSEWDVVKYFIDMWIGEWYNAIDFIDMWIGDGKNVIVIDYASKNRFNITHCWNQGKKRKRKLVVGDLFSQIGVVMVDLDDRIQQKEQL